MTATHRSKIPLSRFVEPLVIIAPFQITKAAVYIND